MGGEGDEKRQTFVVYSNSNVKDLKRDRNENGE